MKKQRIEEAKKQRKSTTLFLFLFSLLLCFFISLPLLSAQQITHDAGTEEKAVREEEKPREPEAKPKRPEIQIPEEAKEEIPAGQRFLVKTIQVTGRAVISAEEIQKITQNYEAKEITLADLKKAAKEITRLYQAKGYLTSRALVPAQEIVDSRATIEIIEAKLGEVRIEGTKHIPQKWIKRRVLSRPGDVLQVKALEKSLVRMNKNPNVEIRAILVKGKAPETTDIVLTVKEKFPFHAGYTFDDQGTKFTGRLRHGIDLSGNGILNLNDRLSAREILTDSHGFVGEVVDYYTPLNERGTSGQLTFSQVNVKLQEHFKRSEVKGRATVFTPSLIQSLWESERWEANWVTGFDFKRVVTRVLSRTDSNDVLRELRFGPNLTEWDRWGRSVMSSSFLFGLPSFLGASDKKEERASRRETGGQFQIYQLTAARIQNLPHSFVLFSRASAQFTPDRLVSAEQFRLGGLATIRGYAEGEYLADYGYQITNELRIPPFLLPRQLQIFHQKILPAETVQFVLFCDAGKGFLNKRLITEDGSKLLVGIGGGILVDISKHLSFRAILGIPLRERSSEENNPRLHFTLTASW